MSKVLVITGGSRGIGEKTIERFTSAGWLAINVSRTPCKIAGVTNVNMDLSSVDDIKTQAAAIKTAIKGASNVCLVHNAAFYRPDSIPTLEITDYEHTLQINVISPLILNQQLIPLMPAESSIIYIGSTLAEKAVPNSASYTVSKHAVIGLMKATCQDLIKQKIRSCCINPGLVDTVLLKETMDQDTIDFLLKNVVIGGRLIEPKEIADVIYFCATTPVINGAVINANLGQVAE